MRVAFVTGGGVGAGHLARGVAIGRALRRRAPGVTYQMLSDRLPYDARLRFPEWSEVPLDPTTLVDPTLARETPLARALVGFRPDIVLVDLFWAHVRHVLPLDGARAWLLLRWAPPGWLDGIEALPYEPSLFERTIAIEPDIPHPTTDAIPPIVIANPDEIAPLALRARHAVPEGRQFVVVAHAGRRGEHETLLALAHKRWPDAYILGHSLFDADAPFPIAPLLAGADAIVGGAGYNFFWELRWLGLAERARLIAFPRTIDDQAWRVYMHAKSTMQENGADVLAEMIARGG